MGGALLRSRGRGIGGIGVDMSEYYMYCQWGVGLFFACFLWVFSNDREYVDYEIKITIKITRIITVVIRAENTIILECLIHFYVT